MCSFVNLYFLLLDCGLVYWCTVVLCCLLVYCTWWVHNANNACIMFHPCPTSVLTISISETQYHSKEQYSHFKLSLLHRDEKKWTVTDITLAWSIKKFVTCTQTNRCAKKGCNYPDRLLPTPRTVVIICRQLLINFSLAGDREHRRDDELELGGKLIVDMDQERVFS